MTKRILVVLDTDDDTPVALDTAISIARRYDGEITCVALVDTDAIDADTSGGGIGSMYYAEKLRRHLKDETRSKARALLDQFTSKLDRAGIRHTEDHVAEGASVQSLVHDMRTHDLLVAGRESHFYYVEPEKRTHTLAKVVEQAAAATLVIEKEAPDVQRVLVAYDGKTTAARTLQKFAHLSPFGTDITVELVHVCEDNDGARLKSGQLLSQASSFLRAYGYTDLVETTLDDGSPAERIAAYAETSGADLLVAGAYSAKGLRKLLFGSTAIKLLNEASLPLFLYS
ncbi:MAG: universal stress protein [Bacteroidota bacterium]